MCSRDWKAVWNPGSIWLYVVINVRHVQPNIGIYEWLLKNILSHSTEHIFLSTKDRVNNTTYGFIMKGICELSII